MQPRSALVIEREEPSLGPHSLPVMAHLTFVASADYRVIQPEQVVKVPGRKELTHKGSTIPLDALTSERVEAAVIQFLRTVFPSYKR